MFSQNIKMIGYMEQGWARSVLLLVVLIFSFGVQAQDTPAATRPESGTRPELLEQLRQVDAQLERARAAGDQENIDHLIELKAQFEILLLQAELEALRQENTSLREQTAPAESLETEATENSAAPSSTEAQMTGMAEAFDALGAEQANALEQLSKIADQHALLFEQLEGSEETEPAQAAADETTHLQQELTMLQTRFETLVAQQTTVNEEVASISDQHAELLTALGAPAEPTPARSYTVQEGDSLSSIAEATYGSATRWPEILAANTILTDPDVLYVGTVLTLP